MIYTVHGYCSKWRLRANVSKSVVIVFSKASVSGEWKWGEHMLRTVSALCKRCVCVREGRTCSGCFAKIPCTSPYTHAFLHVCRYIIL